MKVFIEFIFIFSLLFIFYVYFGYPFLLFVIGIFKRQNRYEEDYLPNVTIIIAAYNEEANIEGNINNKLNLDYPCDKLEIIVVSDGSSDKTDQIVTGYEQQGVKLIRQEPRAGKTSALNLAVPEAKGEIIVFSDANSIYASDALKFLVRNFHRKNIGYITGKMIYTTSTGKSGSAEGCSAYMRYENALRELESRIGSVVGVDGGIDAVRKSLYEPMSADQLPDFILPLKVVKQGFRVIYEPGAILMEQALGKRRDEYKMRVRVTLRALWALFDMRELLSVKTYGIFAVQLWSHKVLRYACFIFLIAAYISNLYLWPYFATYKILFIFQNLLYAGALCAPLLEKRGVEPGPLKYLNYFVLINSAAAHAFGKFALGKKQVIWNPRRG
ncbi:MAG: glycosyltransferase family 2 protein [Desulfobacteraceae bacterium]|nr:glycosyltransferase family 2 protein [Desulfobacteraceae bacterium]